eukprot:CAMPEP_0180759980 /NCGR_PEP_ID=MMETSP1038_2-20121128/36081_1 /TAXON_ID=632150 /ORGANISM="Azadinium spinosum, Strain 3D9" /LENGTH=231 /DNA_ID=CAMNT_0022794121 /DNA_START=91 /DNA_END=783 /DNA_ORIENTATION=-
MPSLALHRRLELLKEAEEHGEARCAVAAEDTELVLAQAHFAALQALALYLKRQPLLPDLALLALELPRLVEEQLLFFEEEGALALQLAFLAAEPLLGLAHLGLQSLLLGCEAFFAFEVVAADDVFLPLLEEATFPLEDPALVERLGCAVQLLVLAFSSTSRPASVRSKSGPIGAASASAASGMAVPPHSADTAAAIRVPTADRRRSRAPGSCEGPTVDAVAAVAATEAIAA